MKVGDRVRLRSVEDPAPGTICGVTQVQASMPPHALQERYYVRWDDGQFPQDAREDPIAAADLVPISGEPSFVGGGT